MNLDDYVEALSLAMAMWDDDSDLAVFHAMWLLRHDRGGEVVMFDNFRHWRRVMT